MHIARHHLKVESAERSECAPSFSLIGTIDSYPRLSWYAIPHNHNPYPPPHRRSSTPVYRTRSVDLLELDLEDEIRVRGDEAGEALGAVRKVARDVEACLLAELHLHDALVPACRWSLAILS